MGTERKPIKQTWDEMTPVQRASCAIAAKMTPEAGYNIKNMAWEQIPFYLRQILIKNWPKGVTHEKPGGSSTEDTAR